MFFNGPLFWFLMGTLSILIAAALRSFADRRGWAMTWWKWLLSIAWYALFSSSFYVFGTLVGENEGGAGLRIFLLGMFASVVLGVGLWRLLTHDSKRVATEAPSTEET